MKTWQKILAAAFFIVLVLAWPVFASEAPDAAQGWTLDAATSTDATPTTKPVTSTDTSPTPTATPSPSPTVVPTPEVVTYSAVTGEPEEITPTGATLSFTFSAPASEDGYTVGVLYGTASDDLSEVFQTGSGFDVAADDGSARLHDLTPSTVYYYSAYVKDNAAGLYYTGDVESFTTAAATQMRPLTAGTSLTLTGESILRFVAPYAGNYRFSLTGAGSIDLRSADDVRNYSAFTPMGDEFCSLEAAMTAGEEFYLDINVFDYSSTGHGVLLAVLLPQTPAVTGTVESGRPTLRWNAVTGASSYYVYRRPAGMGEFTYFAEASERYWTDPSAAAFTEYDYAVRAVSAGGGLSDFSATASLTASPKSGWIQTADGWYYYRSYAPVTGWLQSGDYWYYLGADGLMYDADWFTDASGRTYYLRSGGKMAVGWMRIENVWYYFSAGGVMKTGWLQSGDAWYYLGADGKMYDTSWYTDANGKTYYLKSGGVMAAGWTKIDNVWYYFSAGGVMKTGWLQSGDAWYYLGADGKMYDADWYTDANGKTYYLKSGGKMAAGWTKIDNVWYYFSAGGVMKTGWLKSGSYWYYLKADGKMAAGEDLTIGSAPYTFDSSGRWVG